MKATQTITAEMFLAAVGHEPTDDDLERCNCQKAGEFGHLMCGWDAQRDMPSFIPGARHTLSEGNQ